MFALPRSSAGHLPRAISVPLEDLEARMKDLPKDREIDPKPRAARDHRLPVHAQGPSFVLAAGDRLELLLAVVTSFSSPIRAQQFRLHEDGLHGHET
jgi:hypothetical protein